MISDVDILSYINEDLPYFDLSTDLQDSFDTKAKLELFVRESLVVSCSEVAGRVAEILGCEVLFLKPSKSAVEEGALILSFQGSYESVHKAWKLSQVLLEYACKISTYTNDMLNLAQKVNSKCQILGTRKSFPFAKKLCIKALRDGGGQAHRLNLSDSILYFEKHRIIYKSDAEFYADLEVVKSKIPEKKVCVEALNLDDAFALLGVADVVQLDKMSIEETKKVVKFKDENHKFTKVISAGGINVKNVEEYASCGVDAVVTSAMYLSGIGDIMAKISKI